MLDEEETFVRVYRSCAEDIESKNISLELFGFLRWIELKVNPFNGYFLANFSLMAFILGEDEDRVRQFCKKLKMARKIYYKTQQGQRRKARFYVLGFKLAKKNKEAPNVIVDEEFIKKRECAGYAELQPKIKSVKSSDVEAQIPKLELRQIPSKSTGSAVCGSEDSEVAKKENNNHNETNKNTQNEIQPLTDLTQKISRKSAAKSLKDISSETIRHLIDSSGLGGAKSHLERCGYTSDEIKSKLEEAIKYG